MVASTLEPNEKPLEGFSAVLGAERAAREALDWLVTVAGYNNLPQIRMAAIHSLAVLRAARL